MKILVLMVMSLVSTSAFASSQLVSISLDSYPSEISVITRNASQLLANAAHAKCPTGVSDLTNINFQFANTLGLKTVVEKDAASPGQITLGYVTVVATGLVSCK